MKIKRFQTSRRVLLFRLSLLGIIASLLSIPTAESIINKASKNSLYSTSSTIPKRRVGLVLGCGRNAYFYNRINAAADLYHAGKVEFLLVSGDNHRHGYNEPKEMKKSLINKGIHKDHIFCDYAGFSTLDSIVRAHKIFGQTSFTVISQEFHNKRAIFIGKNRNLDVIGYNAADLPEQYAAYTHTREKFARVKTILDLWFLNRQPRFLGEKVIIPSNHI